jgi:transposase InsO family protein
MPRRTVLTLQGSQYTDDRYQDLLSAHGILPSMNSVGTWYDNAPMESFFGTLKRERVHHCAYQTRNEARPDVFYYIEARPDVFYYIEGFYNRNRLHSSLGYLSPVAYESVHHKHASAA